MESDGGLGELRLDGGLPGGRFRTRSWPPGEQCAPAANRSGSQLGGLHVAVERRSRQARKYCKPKWNLTNECAATANRSERNSKVDLLFLH